jgi:hypothetical protein
MPTPTYDLIAYGTTIAEAVNFDFTSIGNTYRDLVIVIEATNSSGSQTYIRLNSDTSSDYSRVIMTGNGSTATSGSTANDSFLPITSSTTGAFLCIVNIFDYADSKHKTIIARNNFAASEVDARVGRWGNTSVVTSVNIVTSGVWPAGASFYLYGIAA